MRITTNLILVVCCILLVSPVIAVVNVTASDIGSTFITWEWDAPDISEMYVDGNLMCDYESTTPIVTVNGFLPCMDHTIDIFTLTANGTESSTTLCLSPSDSSRVYELTDVADTPLSPTTVLVAIAIACIALGIYRKRE
jgi:hypothetical protein